jgi:hypothetical protein
LIEYLRSGESKVGFLNRSIEKNFLHRDIEARFPKQGYLSDSHENIDIQVEDIGEEQNLPPRAQLKRKNTTSGTIRQFIYIVNDS